MILNIEYVVLVGCFWSVLFQVHRVTSMECGTANFVRPTILGGTVTIKGEWPFIVAIEKSTNYICGGTIISNRHILTAAHCIHKKWSETALSPHEVVVRLGAYNLTNNNEKGVIQMNVSDIIIHDDWDPFERNFDADVAILVLSENVTFTDDIQPVCMPANGITENMNGSVVGYGVQRNRTHSEIPRRIIVRAVSRSHCFREEDGAVAAYTSNRIFCGGNGDGSPDLGDSGSGYFFTLGSSWAQYGIVAIVHTNATGHVFPYAYHAYTNVTMFKDWIIETVNRTGGEVGEARISITMNCDYGYTESTDFNESVYSCRLYNIEIQGKNFETSSFAGSHLYDKSQEDVEEIHFVNGTMSHLPSGFGLFFENIKYLTIGRRSSNSVALGTKIVKRSDLRSLTKLRGLSFRRNDIETLNEDALWDLPDLMFIILVESKLKQLFDKTFVKSEMLTDVNFDSNQLSALPPNLFRNNSNLMVVNFRNNFLKVVDENIFRTNRMLFSVHFCSNQLETLPSHLFQRNLMLMVVHFENNSLWSIDEDLFETNKKLLWVHFRSNRIESLPRKLFRNNLRLHTADFWNNSIATIDEDLFLKNEKLHGVFFGDNKLERLQKNVFKSTSLLTYVHFFNNRLKNIEIDFAEFEHAYVIDLGRNDCVSAAYSQQGIISPRSDINFGNLVEFRNHVLANCASVS